MIELTNIFDKQQVKAIIEGEFGEGINVNEMNYFTAVELARLLVEVYNAKEGRSREVRGHPELISAALRLFSSYVKNEAMFFNEEYGQNIKFSGLLGKYMREIKDSSIRTLEAVGQ